MKKLVAIILMICLFIPCAFAEEIDLSSLSFAELKALQQRVEAEMVKRPEWKGVAVPIGCWRIGTDIPAGS